jgi:hypothetical protein
METESVSKRNKWGHKLCPHSRFYHRCKDCGGTSICEHNRQRNVCKNCHGSQICKHNRLRSYCKICRPIGAYDKYKRHAEDAKLPFLITFEQYQEIVVKPCKYCGADKEPNGMDKVIPEKGYTLENVVSCCWPCNKMKNNYSVVEFLSHIKRIAEYSK